MSNNFSKQNLPDRLAINDDSPRTYTLIDTIIYRGETKGPGEKVELDDQQAKRLRETGHIA